MACTRYPMDDAVTAFHNGKCLARVGYTKAEVLSYRRGYLWGCSHPALADLEVSSACGRHTPMIEGMDDALWDLPREADPAARS